MKGDMANTEADQGIRKIPSDEELVKKYPDIHETKGYANHVGMFSSLEYIRIEDIEYLMSMWPRIMESFRNDCSNSTDQEIKNFIAEQMRKKDIEGLRPIDTIQIAAFRQELEARMDYRRILFKKEKTNIISA